MANVDTSIFKAYDIRGIYPEQINGELVYKIAQAYAKFINPKTVAVGTDMRLSGQEFKEAAIRGLTDAGVNVVDIGLVSTDTLYFAVPFLDLDGGLQITASHNPKEYGGMKMVREKGRPISGDTGIKDIRNFVVDNIEVKSDKKGEVAERNIIKEYFLHVARPFDLSGIKPFKIVANPNFGMANQALGHLKEMLPVEFVEILNGEINGNFPKGRPDPLVPSNRDETIAAVKKHKADLGVAWDADADRVFFFDEQGSFITPAYVSALLAKYYLEKNPGAKILHDTRVVRVIDHMVKECGGEVVMNKAGHSFIKERMIQDDVVFGCETSGHYFFKDNYYLDNGIMPFLAVLEILSKENKPFTELLAPLREKFYIEEETNVTFQNQNVLEEIKKKYADAQIENIDGYDFNYPDWRFNVRMSNTEPLMRINMEANSKKLLDEKFKEVMEFIETIK